MQNTPASARSRQTVDFTNEAAALALAAAVSDVRIEIFGRDWTVVDRMRSRIAAIGLAHRVGVHHLHAFVCPLVRTAVRRGGAKVVFVAAA